MKYYRISHSGTKREIDYEKALGILLGTYKNTDVTRDMLKIPNYIPCRFSTIQVVGDDGKVCMAGLVNLLPMDAEYNDDGMRIN